MKHLIISLLIFVFLVISQVTSWAVIPAPLGIQFSDPVQTTKTITQFGITWTFSEPVEYGQFVNGDYWVIDPGNGVKIINITPGDAIRAGTAQHMNGSMLNPHTPLQGYDESQNYSSVANVGIGVSAGTPLVLSGDISLVSTISNLIVGVLNVSYVNTAAVLTCLSSFPPSGSFRPGISATTKTLHNISSVDYNKLGKLYVPSSNKPDIQMYANYLQMVWLTHSGVWTGRYMHPSNSGLDNYYFSRTFGQAAKILHYDYTNEQKTQLLVNFIQLGIDIYSYIESGARGWPPDGGHSSGRKWPILFAGIILDYAPMKDIGQRSGDYLYADGYGPGNPPPDYIHFGEDGQTFYVSQADIDITNGPTWNPDTDNPGYSPYTTAMVGMPEWGIRYSGEPNRSDASWGANYRLIYSGVPAWEGSMMSCLIMGAKKLWNHNVFFDYVDRYMAISRGQEDPFGYTVPDQKAGGAEGSILWDLYRANY